MEETLQKTSVAVGTSGGEVVEVACHNNHEEHTASWAVAEDSKLRVVAGTCYAAEGDSMGTLDVAEASRVEAAQEDIRHQQPVLEEVEADTSWKEEAVADKQPATKHNTLAHAPFQGVSSVYFWTTRQ